MIGQEQLRRMKPGAFLVNTARGHIVDEVALEKALRQGQIAGAAMDVFAEEPPRKEHPLLSLDNFVATPHVAGATEESMGRMATELADEVLRVLRGEKPLSCVNPEIYD
jgi:D-3-phosphoglycerate dehydrogenase